MTSAPLSAAQRTPLAMSSYAPLPSSSTFTGMIFAPGATPAMPTPLLVAAAAMPETWVPWVSDGCATPSGPFQSPLPQDGLQPMKVAPDTSWPCRSAWLRSTPVSTTAMTAPAPVLVAHACSACTCWGPYCLA